MGSFLRIDYPRRKRPPGKAPVLVRVRHRKRRWDPLEPPEAIRRELGRYPVRVWYGGPTTFQAAQDIMRQLGPWMASLGRAWAAELVTIAPELASHRWPWRRFRWWAKTERKQRPLYRLVRKSPVEFQWRRWTV